MLGIVAPVAVQNHPAARGAPGFKTRGEDFVLGTVAPVACGERRSQEFKFQDGGKGGGGHFLWLRSSLPLPFRAIPW